VCGHTDQNGCRCSRQGLNHPSLFERNMVNPTFRLVGGKRFRKERCGNAGRGTLEKAKAVL
jgi:hypothetical protein